MNTYTFTLFNTGQVTLPKAWREQFDTRHFLAKETEEGLLVKPLTENVDDVVFYENKGEFGLYSAKGMDPEKIIKAIQKLHGQKNNGK